MGTKFTVIIPVHNKGPHIRRSIMSVINQRYKNFEIIIIDDASNDNSVEIINLIDDPRILLLKRTKPGPGGYAARNLGIEAANSDWICFLDADDEWDVNYLDKVQKMRIEVPDAMIIATSWIEKLQGRQVNISNKENRTTEFSLIDFLKNHKLMWTGAVSIRRDLLLSVGMFPKDKGCINGGDLDTWIRCLNQSKKSVYTNEVLSYYYKDTVNQVTDYKVNPSYCFCAYDTLVEIRKLNTDNLLNREINHYINRSIYNIQYRQVQNGYKINYSLICKMTFCNYSISRFIMLHLYLMKFSLKK